MSCFRERSVKLVSLSVEEYRLLVKHLIVIFSFVSPAWVVLRSMPVSELLRRSLQANFAGLTCQCLILQHVNSINMKPQAKLLVYI